MAHPTMHNYYIMKLISFFGEIYIEVDVM